LGVTLGSEFKSAFLKEEVSQWQDDVIQLSNFVTSESHAAYSTMIHGRPAAELVVNHIMSF